MRKHAPLYLAVAASLALAVLTPGISGAHPSPRQHPGGTDHLTGSGAFGNIELVSVEDVTDTPDLVADVAVSPDGNWAFWPTGASPTARDPRPAARTPRTPARG